MTSVPIFILAQGAARLVVNEREREPSLVTKRVEGKDENSDDGPRSTFEPSGALGLAQALGAPSPALENDSSLAFIHNFVSFSSPYSPQLPLPPSTRATNSARLRSSQVLGRRRTPRAGYRGSVGTRGSEGVLGVGKDGAGIAWWCQGEFPVKRRSR